MLPTTRKNWILLENIAFTNSHYVILITSKLLLQKLSTTTPEKYEGTMYNFSNYHPEEIGH
jgi:hypothetical protein